MKVSYTWRESADLMFGEMECGSMLSYESEETIYNYMKAMKNGNERKLLSTNLNITE